MSEEYLHDDQIYRERSADGRVTLLRPAERARRTTAQLPQQAAVEFLAAHAEQLGIQPGWLTGASLVASDATALSDGDSIGLLFATEKHQFDTTTVVFQQTWNGIPVWRCGTTVTMKTDPARVAGVQNTSFPSITVKRRPDVARIGATVTGKRGVIAEAFGLTKAPVTAAGVGSAADVVASDDRQA